MSILKIHAREIFDSRGNPTVEVDLYTKKGTATDLYRCIYSLLRCAVCFSEFDADQFKCKVLR